jgi:hypothetical protein
MFLFCQANYNQPNDKHPTEKQPFLPPPQAGKEIVIGKAA